MSNKFKDPYEQLFNIGRSLAFEIMNSSDEEFISNDIAESLLKKTSGELIYEKALNTIKQKKEKSPHNEGDGFNLSKLMLLGINASEVRLQLSNLKAANDSSLLLVASDIDNLSDAEVIKIYQELLKEGLLKL